MDFVIVFRNPATGAVGFISDGDQVAVFKDQDEAERIADDHALLQAWPYEVIEINV